MTSPLPVLDYLRRYLAGQLTADDRTWLRYPTPISQLLRFDIVAVGDRTASIRVQVTPDVHGNQQGTVHGGTIAELADAAIGTAHSTVIGAGESFATVELTIRYFRPVWEATLNATATVVHAGRTLSQYRCEIRDTETRLIAVADSSVMTVNGDRSAPRPS